MISEATDAKAEQLARLIGRDSGDALVDELLEKQRLDWERQALETVVADAKESGMSTIPASEMGSWVKNEGRRRRETN